MCEFWLTLTAMFVRRSQLWTFYHVTWGLHALALCSRYTTVYRACATERHSSIEMQAQLNPGSRLWPKLWKNHFSMATAPDANMLSTKFWLIIVLSSVVKTYRSLKIEFFVKIKNVTTVLFVTSHETESCTKMTSKSFKSKNYLTLWYFVLSNTRWWTTSTWYLKTISYTSSVRHMKFYHSGLLLMQYSVW